MQPACDFNVGERRLVMAFVPDSDQVQVIGWTVVVDFACDGPTLPSWWQVQPDGCRAGQLVAVSPTGFEGECADPWSVTGSAVVQSLIYPRPGGDGRQLRVILGVGVPNGQAFPLVAGEPILAGVLGLHFARTNTGDCPGCTEPVCFVFNSLEIARAPGAPGADPAPFVTPNPSFGNQCTWGGGTACALVPVRARSWGQIKTLYR
jgi:hypothetical protein